MQIKLVLGRLTVEQAVRNASAADIEVLTARLEAFCQAAAPGQVLEAVFDYYHELAPVSGNMLMPLDLPFIPHPHIEPLGPLCPQARYCLALRSRETYED